MTNCHIFFKNSDYTFKKEIKLELEQGFMFKNILLKSYTHNELQTFRLKNTYNEMFKVW